MSDTRDNLHKAETKQNGIEMKLKSVSDEGLKMQSAIDELKSSTVSNEFR